LETPTILVSKEDFLGKRKKQSVAEFEKVNAKDERKGLKNGRTW